MPLLKTPPPLLTSIVLFVQVAFAVLGSGFAFCQEADGALAIEWQSAGCCEESELQEAREPGASEVAPGAECAGCEDQLLPPGERPEAAPEDLLPPPVSLGFVEPALLRCRFASAPDLLPRAGPHLRLLRSVVIRC